MDKRFSVRPFSGMKYNVVTDHGWGGSLHTGHKKRAICRCNVCVMCDISTNISFETALPDVVHWGHRHRLIPPHLSAVKTHQIYRLPINLTAPIDNGGCMQNTSRNLVEYRICYRIRELAKMVGMSPEFVRTQIKSGQLRAYRLGGNVIILPADLDLWLKSQPINSESTELSQEDNDSLAA